MRARRPSPSRGGPIPSHPAVEEPGVLALRAPGGERRVGVLRTRARRSRYPTASILGAVLLLLYTLPFVWFITRADRYEREPREARRARVPLGRPRGDLDDGAAWQRGHPLHLRQGLQRRLRLDVGAAADRAARRGDVEVRRADPALPAGPQPRPLGVRRPAPGCVRRPRVPGARGLLVHRQRRRRQLRREPGRGHDHHLRPARRDRALVARALHRHRRCGPGYLARRAARSDTGSPSPRWPS